MQVIKTEPGRGSGAKRNIDRSLVERRVVGDTGYVTLDVARRMQRELRCAECVRHGKYGRLLIEAEDVYRGELKCLMHSVVVARIQMAPPPFSNSLDVAVQQLARRRRPLRA